MKQTSSQSDLTPPDSADNPRRRVGKACDRCRLKKAKCDGATPCSRCRLDNAICVFGDRKRPHDRVHPRGYVEMLEQQQAQLVTGLQESYRRLLVADQWPGEPLARLGSQALTHDILVALNVLDPTNPAELFEDDTDKIRQRLLAAGAPLLTRRGSITSEDSDQSHKRASSSTYSSCTPLSPHPAKKAQGYTSSSSGTITSAELTPLPDLFDSVSMPFTTEPCDLKLADVDSTAILSNWTWADIASADCNMQDLPFKFSDMSASDAGAMTIEGIETASLDTTLMTDPSALGVMDFATMKQPHDAPSELGRLIPVPVEMR